MNIFYLCNFTDTTPERDKSPDPGRYSVSPVPDMDGKRLRLSLHSPVLSPLNKPIVPVRVSDNTYCQINTAEVQWLFCSHIEYIFIISVLLLHYYDLTKM